MSVPAGPAPTPINDHGMPVGSLVRFKAGGPKMVVGNVIAERPTDGSTHSCWWFNTVEGKFCYQWLAPHMLEPDQAPHPYRDHDSVLRGAP